MTYIPASNNGFNEGVGGTATIHYAVPPTSTPWLSGVISITATSTAGTGVARHDTFTLNGHTVTLDTGVGPGGVGNSIPLDATNLAYINSTQGTTITGFFTPVGGGVTTCEVAINVFLYGSDVTSLVTTSPSPGGNGGYPGGTARGISSNPFAAFMPASKVTEISTDALALSARVHRLSVHWQQVFCELWYNRDAQWFMFPTQPCQTANDHPQLVWSYREPPRLTVSFMDEFGYYAPQNLESPYNYNQSAAYDPLIDEARQVCFRVGVLCFANLAAGLTPTLSSSPGNTVATLTNSNISYATDGLLTDYSANAVHTEWQIAPNADTSITVELDLGSVQSIRHAVIRFGTKHGVGILPSEVSFMCSMNGTVWSGALAARPVGGDMSTSSVTGDWDENYNGAAVEVPFIDLDYSARYVRFIITPQSVFPNVISIDEIAVYGGNTTQILGRNMFVGYMGDAIDFTSTPGTIKCTIIGIEKKAADNNDVVLTLPYLMTAAGAVELADIVYSLLTSAPYWKGGSNAYNAPFSAGEVDWTINTQYTGMAFPLWQGQKNTVLGYALELAHAIGWILYGDPNGIWQLYEPPYNQYSPDRVFIAATLDGIGDCRKAVRHRTGKNMRNVVSVGCGASNTGGSGITQLEEPNSVARYGTRTTTIVDPIANSVEVRDKIASYFIRDFAWRLQTLEVEIAPDFHTYIKTVHAFRAPALDRTSLYAKAEDTVGYRRARELWSMESITQHFMHGKWWGDAMYVPYYPQGSIAPIITSVTTSAPSGGMATVTLNWEPITDQRVSSINIYYSSTSEYTGFTWLQLGVVSSLTTLTLGPFSTSNELWFYMTTVDVNGTESVQSQTVSVLPGGTAVGPAQYIVTDYTVAFLFVQGPDAQGYYTYTFGATWTSPAGGFTQSRVFAADGAVPANATDTNSWPISDSKWNWWAPNRIPTGLEYDRVTVGQLNATYVFRTLTNLSGHTIYWRMFSSTATRSWHPVANNISAVTVP